MCVAVCGGSGVFVCGGSGALAFRVSQEHVAQLVTRNRKGKKSDIC